MFKRRPGTAGICGHLYETKLIGLLYFRAFHDKRIDTFQLGSNVDEIGAFDDICFKAIVKQEGEPNKPVYVFVQAKHKENEKRTLKIDLATYFISYLQIRQKFNPSNKDVFFTDTFDVTECLFVIYTTAKDEFDDNTYESNFSSHLYKLLGTGGSAKRADQRADDVEVLSKLANEYQLTSLAALMAKIIMNVEKFELMMTKELIQRFHVILAKYVVDVSDIKPDGHRTATFRREFFDTHEENLILFKDTLYKEIVKNNKIAPTNIQGLLSQFLAAPSDADVLSKLIGAVVSYNNENGQININKDYTEYLTPQNSMLNQVYVSAFTVKQAVESAAKEILLFREFKVPAAFGNKDLLIAGNDVKVEKRLNHITSKMIEKIKKYESNKIVILDESLEDGLQQLNGGLASAIGNIFVLEDNAKLVRITNKPESLGDLAKRLYEKLNEKVENLFEYTFCFRIRKFPKLFLESDSYEEFLATDFLNKFLIYSNQTDEKNVEEKIKDEIEEELSYSDFSKAKTDAIFLKYHDLIQTWWMLPKKAPYLTMKDNLFGTATSYITDDPLIRSLSVPYVRKIVQYNYTFTEDAVRSLNLQEQYSTTVIIAENIVLTVIKVMQHLKNKEHILLDIEDIVNLPTKDRNAIRRELASTKQDNFLIFVCNKVKDLEKKTYENVAEAVSSKKVIIITNEESAETLKEYFKQCDCTVYDKKNSLVHMSDDSQKSVLENARVKFQGLEVGLKHLVRG